MSHRQAEYAFLAGGGEMGQLIREHPWSATPLGPVETWPQSLRSAVSILLPSKAQIVLFWGPELVALYNDAYAPVFGAKHPWALGRPARECWSEVWHVIGPLFEGVVRTGEAFWAKEHPFFLHRQGFLEETYFDVSYDPVRAEDGSVHGVFCIVSEQTGRVLGERRLRILRELGTRTADAKSTEEVGREAAAALAMDPADVPFALLCLFDGPGLRAQLVGAVGVGSEDLARGRDIAITDVAVLASARQGQAVEVETSAFVIRAPETTAGRALVLPISSGTQIVGALVAGVSRFLRLTGDYRDFFDLAAARISAAIANARAYTEERRRAEALAELDRAKTAFFSNVSHEFRTPLTLMLGPVDDILAKPETAGPPENRELLAVVRRNGLRLQKLVNTLLDFARIEAGRIRAEYEPTDLGGVTAELASNFRSACERAGLRLVVDCPSLSEPVYVDRDMWEKIVLNLLSNAFKFTFTGGIAVALRSAGAGVELAVRDTGTGIAPEEIPHLFERFHRVKGARGRTHEGTGIGLALVQELVKLHGGSVRVESVCGQGSVFIVSIPTGRAHLPAEQVQATRTPASAALGASPYVEEALRWLPDGEPLPVLPSADATGLDAMLPSPPLALSSSRRPEESRRSRILWADDNADMRDYVRRLLGARYDVEAVSDGEAALAAARARRPDLVLADVMMPKLDGLELLREVRADPRLRAVPVILLSARAREESRLEGLELGADDYLVKPFSARELLAHVSARLELGRLRARLEDERAALAELFRQTPMPIAVLRGADLVYDMANPAYLEVVGRRDIVGRPLLDALPELKGQGLEDVLRGVMRTGIAHVGHEALLGLDREGTGELEETYWTFIYAPLRDDHGHIDRVVAICNEVTEQVQARHRIQAERRRTEEIHAQLAAIIASSDDAIVSKTLDGVITSWNHGAERIFGYPAGEAVGQHISLIIPEERRAEEDDVLARLRRGERVDHFETERRTKDGRRISISLTVSPIEDFEGRIIGASKVARDITERQRAEAALRASEERFRALADLAPAIIWTAAPDGTITFHNRQWLHYCGITPEQNARDWPELVLHPDDRARCLAQWTHALRTGSEYEIEVRNRRHDGEYRWFLTRATPVREAEGRLTGWFGTSTDIHDRKRAEEVLQEADQRKDEFLATLSHELRTPLNSMLGWVRLLRSGTLDAATARRALEVVERNVTHQGRLITDLLDISRIISGKLTLELGVVDLTAVVASVIEATRPGAEAKGIALMSLGADRAVPVRGDVERLRQVVANLLSNAVKFTAQGGWVTVRVVSVDDRVRLTVSDSGKGIAPEFLPHIFERFRQADSSSTRAQAGLGLGLAIVRHIVELHEGRVRAESPGVGQGAIFTVDIPLATPAADRGAAAGDETETAGLALGALAGIRVLIVEDDADSRDLLATILAQEGAEVTAVETVREALGATRHAGPDVIVCDLAMPGDDGFAFIAAIRSRSSEHGRAIPALALSAYARPEDRERALAAGFQLHLSKPVEPRALLEAVIRLARPGQGQAASPPDVRSRSRAGIAPRERSNS